MNQRERFEAEAEKMNLYLDTNLEGKYLYWTTEAAWSAWQEAERQMKERRDRP